MDESLAWLLQANSDREAAEREYRTTVDAGSDVWCHAIAKYQQAVEKAVKAMVAALHEAGFWRGPPIGFVHEVARHMRFLVRLPRRTQLEPVRRQIMRVLDATTRATIQSLEQLIPQAPAANQPLRRNTEYPFHDASAEFTYPARPGVFASAELDRFRRLSFRLAESAGWVVATLRRRPRA